MEANVSKPTNAGASTTIILGWVAIKPNIRIPNIANPGGSQLAGRRRFGQANQSAPMTSPIRPAAAEMALTFAVCSARFVIQIHSVIRTIAITKTRDLLGSCFDFG